MVKSADGVKPRKGPPKLAASSAETARVTRLLRRDRQDAAAEAEREAAEREVREGRASAAARARIGPTRETADQFEPHLVEEISGAGARMVETVRRISENRVKQLHDRGVFTDDTYPAVLWYQRQFEAAGFTLGASAAAWGDGSRGEPAYGVMPRTAVAAEAREMFRFARGGRTLDGEDGPYAEGWALPADMLPTFDLVVLSEMTIAEAAATARCRYSNAAAAVRHVALMLLGRVEHLLPVRAVGAPGSVPLETVLELGTHITEQAISNAIFEMEINRSAVPPEFINARGFMRPAAVIAKMIRGEELTDEEMEL